MTYYFSLRMLTFLTTNDDVCTMRRNSRNILQWNKSDIKSKKMTNGDYSNTTNKRANGAKGPWNESTWGHLLQKKEKKKKFNLFQFHYI